MKLIKRAYLTCTCVLLSACSTDIDIQQIGEDIQLNLPNQYTALGQQEDWLGFDLTQQYDLQFSNENAINIEREIQDADGYTEIEYGFNSDNSVSFDAPNSRWFKGGIGRYGYRSCKETTDVTEYCILASFEAKSGILRYRFMDF